MEFNCYDVLEVQGSRYVITEKIKYKAEIKVPYKHILNSKNEIVSIDEIQKKWDIGYYQSF